MDVMLRKVKRKIRNIIEKCFLLNETKIIEEIKKADVVSFDIFDTLVKRDVEDPEDIHILAGLKFAEKTGREIKGYNQRRVQAEDTAKNCAGKNEITLQGIFHQVKDISEKDKKLLFQLEQELEYEICHQNPKMKKIYDIVQSMGKHIVITSDMYLPEELIHRILEKCEYKGYEKIYLSSSYGVTKSSGKLFKYLKEDYKDLSYKIVHIGDNVKSDFYRAKEAGIKAVLVGRERKNLSFYKKSEMRTWEEKCFYTFLNNHKTLSENLDKNEKGRDVFARAVGYEILGPILWGYIQWLQKQLKADGIEKIFFLSREGALLQTAYQILFPDSKVVQSYLYVSRQALQVPILSECHDYNEMIQVMKPMMRSHTLDNIGRECAFDNCYWEECRKLNLDTQSSVFDIPPEKQKSYYDLVHRLGKNNFGEQKEFVQTYLKQEGFEGKAAIADIGWQGSMQKTLSLYCEAVEIIGYYIGVRNIRADEYYEGLTRKGYLFEPGKHEEWDLKMRFATEIMETLFLNSDGSVTGYRKKGSWIEPCLGKSEYEGNNSIFLSEVQAAALQFLKDWKHSVFSDYGLADDTIMKGYEHFAVRPTLKTVSCFEEFYYLDGGIKKRLLLDKSIFYYLCYPHKLFIDMDKSACKIFALKELFKLPFPYYSLLKFFLYGLKIKSPCAQNMEQ